MKGTTAKRLETFFEAHCKPGKQALTKRDRDRVDLNLECSVELDAWGQARWPRSHRWDYVVVEATSGALAVEVHPANAKEVSEVIAKKAWAVERLRDAQVTAESWWWIPSGKTSIPATGRHRRQLAAAGIKMARRTLDRAQVG